MTRMGFPHSDISGSMHICCSPKLIAAYRVLHRLPMPRHSPCALFRLNYSPLAFANFVPYMSIANRFFSRSLIVIQLPACTEKPFSTTLKLSFLFVFNDSSVFRLFSQTSICLLFLYSVFNVHSVDFHLLGGLKWIRTIDLALNRRAL